MDIGGSQLAASTYLFQKRARAIEGRKEEKADVQLSLSTNQDGSTYQVGKVKFAYLSTQ